MTSEHLSKSEENDQDKTLLIVGRSNYKVRSDSIVSLINSICDHGYKCLWFQTDYERIALPLDAQYEEIVRTRFGADKEFGVTAKRLIKLFLLLSSGNAITFIKLYLKRWRRSNETLSKHTSLELGAFLNSCSIKNIDLLAHSAGGVAATLVSNKTNVRRLVCFGYPFKHPDATEETYRTEHLKQVNKPLLIIQGTHDEYGAPEDAARYSLSQTTIVQPLDSDHNYDNLTQKQEAIVLRKILLFLN